jgi:hypothetical protein
MRLLRNSSAAISVTVALLGSFCSLVSDANAGLSDVCSFERIAVEPAPGARPERFVGRGERAEIEFKNEQFERPVEVFPESPLIVRRIDSGKSCEIDGGAWARNAVFLNHSNSRLFVKEFSGSNERLVMYDTATCVAKTKLDVSNRAWQLQATQLVIGENCKSDGVESCRKLLKYRFDRQCRPVKLR